MDLLSYSAGLVTSGVVLMIVGGIAHLTDNPEREPQATAGRFELMELGDDEAWPSPCANHTWVLGSLPERRARRIIEGCELCQIGTNRHRTTTGGASG
jgi:hypothetical protein